MSLPTLCFDTETAGLPNWKASFDLPEQPHLFELGWIFSPSGLEHAPSSQGHVYVDWKEEVPFDAKAQETNGLTHRFLWDTGVGPRVVFMLWAQMMDKARRVVGHNISFDMDIMEIHAYRLRLHDLFKQVTAGKELFCTKKHGTSICNLPPYPGRSLPKPPKLVELHTHFFDKPHEGAHGALKDTIATWNCYHKIQEIASGGVVG